MEDFPLLILFFIIYLIAGASGKKKGKKRSRTRERGPMRNRAQGEQYDPRASRQDRQTMEGFHSAFSDHTAAEQPCDQKRMHLHEVSGEQLQHAAEGEDPCHVGDAREERVMESAVQDETSELLAQDILRGVIMSEILTRPCERMTMRRGRR